MGKKCVVPKCRSGLGSNPEKISLFSVPQKRLELWQKALPVKHRPLTVKDRVCAKHFRQSDIVREIKTETYSYPLQTPKLSPDAIPSIFHLRGNYPLRSSSSETCGQSSKKCPRGSIKSREKLPKPQSEPAYTVEENEFKTQLQLNGQRFHGEKTLPKDEYEHLQSVLQDNSGGNEISKRFGVVEVDTVKAPITGDDKSTKQLLHDDELYHVLCTSHLKTGHHNNYKMLAELERTYQNITPRDIALFVQLCSGCKPKSFDYITLQEESIISNDMAAKCSVNFIDYRSCPDDGYTRLMVYQNHQTKFCLLKPLKSDSPVEIAENLTDIFSFIGVSTEIESTKEGALWDFIAYELKRLWPRLEFKQVQTTHCQIQLDIWQSLKLLMQENKNYEWVRRIPLLQLEINKTIGCGTNVKPYEALFGTTGNSAVSVDAEVTNSAVSILDEVRNSAAGISEEDEDLEKQHFETVYSDDYIEEASMEAVCAKDPFAAINDTVEHIEPPHTYQITKQRCKEDGSSDYIFGLLSGRYPNRDKAPEGVEAEFKRQLRLNRKDHTFYKTLSKRTYDKLMTRAKELKAQYEVVTVRNVNRLIRAGGAKQPKYYVHDDEIFHILHYTHINLDHADRERMRTTLNQRFANIINRDITTYLQLCLQCKPKTQKYEFRREFSEHSAASELSARCSVSFIDYQTLPDGNYEFVMIYKNSLTKFIMLKPLILKDPAGVAHHLIDIFTFLGISHFIESTENPDFFKCVIQHMKFVWPDADISYHRSEGNCNARNIKHDLQIWMGQNKTRAWAKGLKFVQLMRNRDYHSEIQEAPYNALFGFVDASCGSGNNNHTT